MQITAGIGIYWSSLQHAQIGIDNRIAQSFSGLTKNELRFIEALTRPYSTEEIILLGAKYKIASSRREKIMQLLKTLNLLEPAALENLDPHLRNEYRAHWRIHCEIPAQRKNTKIFIPHLDWLSTEIALSLAAAGIAHFTLHDSTPVGTFSHPVLQKQIIGIAKNRALANHFRANFPHVKCETDKLNPTNCATEKLSFLKHRVKTPCTTQIAIIATNNAPDPLTIDTYLSCGIPVLIILAGEIDLMIGPLCIPSNGPCGMCVERYKNDACPNWAVLAPQARAIHNLPLPIANAKLAASFALRAILEFIDTAKTNALFNQKDNLSTRSQMPKENQNPLHLPVCSTEARESLQLFSRAWIIPPNPALPYLKSFQPHPECLCKINSHLQNSRAPSKNQTN